ncbi:16S rRNA (adenine(1518)-N(6)/adenine(1519)-N(6))-dimethyltransferase RsmA [Nitratifractor sp.]
MNNYRTSAGEIADKRFGQNFLKDESIVRQIIQAMPDDDLPVVEIGPGLGDLTKELVRVRQVTAYEVDKRLCEFLREEFSREIAEGKLHLECGDVLERWSEGGLSDRPYRLIANLPYYIATHILLRALRDPLCRSTLTMVQKEVAEKFAAPTGDRNFSALSVLAQSAGEARGLFDVPPEAFAPPPKVTSSILEIRKERNLEDEGFERFLKTAFRQPRKTLYRNLASVYPKAALDPLYTEMDLPRNSRPHQVGTTLYHRLYHALTKESDHGKKFQAIDGKPEPISK